VRFGLAAGRPVVVTRHHHFRDLFSYPDEVYFVENDDLTATVKKVLNDIDNGCAKFPNKLLEDMSWTKCASMYVDLYKGLNQ
jgi:hypothetical protein